MSFADVSAIDAHEGKKAMKQVNKVILAYLAGWGLTACGTGQSEDVNQSRIVQSYALSYGEQDALLKATASFHYENPFGTSLRLSGPSSVSFAGQLMNYENILDSARYTLKQQHHDLSFVPLSFRYVNNAGETFQVDAPLPEAFVLRSPSDGSWISRGQELTVRLEKPATGDSDDVQACLTGEAGPKGEAAHEECLYFGRRASVVFSREQLEAFALGSSVSLKLTSTRHPSQNNANIQVLTQRIARPLTLRIREF